VATLRSININLPGTYGLNTIEDTVPAEAETQSRFGLVVTNGVVDRNGKVTSRQDFVNQTAGFSNTLSAIFTHRNSDGTDTVLSAGAGIAYSGIASLTSRFDYRAGSQIVDVGGAKTGASASGLANDATAYTCTVVIDGVTKNVSVVGNVSQTYTTLMAEINTDLGAAGSVSLVGGNLKFISATTGASSTVATTAGTLFTGALPTGFVAIRTASAGTITNDNWQFASLSGKIFMAQAGQAFTCLNESTFDVVSVVGQPWTSSPNIVVAGYGRLWAADDAAGGNRYTLWWSNLLDGTALNSGDAGNLSLINAWPQGQDSVVAVVPAFGRVVVLGRNSILLYTLPADNDPASMSLTHTVSNIGCVARDSVIVTDDGIYFLSDNSVFRIDQLGQVTSLLNLENMSKLYAEDVVSALAAETTTKIRAGYYPKDGLYVLSFPTSNATFCLHPRKMIPEVDVPPATKWTNVARPFRGFCFDKDGNWYCAGTNGVHKYTGYVPDGANNAYSLLFYTQWNNFGDEARLKHLKAVTLVLEAASGQTGTLYWLEDYLAGTENSETFTCDAVEFAENPGIGHVRVAIGGSCNVVQVGVGFVINAAAVTLQQMRIFATPGAMKP